MTTTQPPQSLTATASDLPKDSQKSNQTTSSPRLVAFVVVNGKPMPPTPELIDFLRQRLPDYMIPSGFVPVTNIPRTPNGKVDRHALAHQAPAIRSKPQHQTNTSDPLEQKLITLWSEVLGVDGISPTDNFFELGGHSLIAIRLFSQIREEFGTKLPLATLFESPTISQMAQLLRRPPKTDTLRSPLVYIQSKGNKRPLFFVHGVGGEVLIFQQLAKHIGEDQPFYGLQAKGIDLRDQPDTSVKQMAARYIKAIRVIDPQGPYVLGGFSSGGTIAYEMARQLREEGKKIQHLIILENAPPNIDIYPAIWLPRSLARIAMNLPWWIIDDLFTTNPKHMYNRIVGRLRLLRDRIKRGPGQRTAHLAEADIQDFLGVTNLAEHRHNFLQTHYRALLDYTPPPMDIQIYLVISRARPLLYRGDRDLGWSQVTSRKVDVATLPGSHDHMLIEPHVIQLANMINDSITNSYHSHQDNPRQR